MKSILRTIGAFLYASLVSVGFYYLSGFILKNAIHHSNGAGSTFGAIVAIVLVLGFISEGGVSLISIPFNWLWDRTAPPRIATVIPYLPAFIWCMTIPGNLPGTFDTGDWIIVIVWVILVLIFFYNMFMFPFLNPHIGIGCGNNSK